MGFIDNDELKILSTRPDVSRNLAKLGGSGFELAEQVASLCGVIHSLNAMRRSLVWSTGLSLSLLARAATARGAPCGDVVIHAVGAVALVDQVCGQMLR